MKIVSTIQWARDLQDDSGILGLTPQKSCPNQGNPYPPKCHIFVRQNIHLSAPDDRAPRSSVGESSPDAQGAIVIGQPV